MRLLDVWVRYRLGPWVLRAVDVHLAPGSAAVVLGRNGVGKSTLLQVAAGVLRPTRGRVRDRPGVVAFVPERFPADQPFTLSAYLSAVGGARGLRGERLGWAVDHWTERLGITPYLGVRLPALSKGTAQKVGLIQALLVTPQLLVLDEPWEGLDAAARDLVPILLAEVLADGGSVLVSDHRGETARLAGAAQWMVGDATVTPAEPRDEAHCIVELMVPAPEVTGALARLRADGHQVLRVRREPAAPGAEVVR